MAAKSTGMIGGQAFRSTSRSDPRINNSSYSQLSWLGLSCILTKAAFHVDL
uniref:Uncharacterized protein n=1 Tax=Oryza brachyantha TaxID=4533 RepID=J3LAU9_ORYBR